MGEVVSLVSLWSAVPTTIKAFAAKCALSNTASRVLQNEEWHYITRLITLGLGGSLLTQNHLTSTQRIRTHLVQDTSLYDLAKWQVTWTYRTSAEYKLYIYSCVLLETFPISAEHFTRIKKVLFWNIASSSHSSCLSWEISTTGCTHTLMHAAQGILWRHWGSLCSCRG